ncbi:hypothetical protein BDZ91DRAFT_711891 [Kalaharituber pfeilii]|nr:hypothetical protein BDZ91DRAFT_711891 [Kalaharituber pfeilii]
MMYDDNRRIEEKTPPEINGRISGETTLTRGINDRAQKQKGLCNIMDNSLGAGRSDVGKIVVWGVWMSKWPLRRD